MLSRTAAVLSGLALCAMFFVVSWAQISAGYSGPKGISGYSFFVMGLDMADAQNRFDDMMSFVWVAAAPLFTILAVLTTVAGLPSRLLVLIGGLSFLASCSYVSVMSILTRGGEVLPGAYVTAALALFFIVMGMNARRSYSQGIVQGSRSPAH